MDSALTIPPLFLCIDRLYKDILHNDRAYLISDNITEPICDITNWNSLDFATNGITNNTNILITTAKSYHEKKYGPDLQLITIENKLTKRSFCIAGKPSD